METIEKGAVSGTLPEMECFAIHYPGYPASVSRAVETLGGLEEIGKKRSFGARRVETRPENRNDGRLELRFRPEDPYCHPAFGDLRPCSGLLLKISKKRKKKKEKNPQEKENIPEANRQEATNAESVKLSCSIVARVHDSYCFDGLADYQFIVPVHAAKAKQAKRRWDEVDPIIDNGGMMDMEQDEMFMLVPKLFSTKDMPDEILLKVSAGSTPKESQQQQALEEHNWEMNIAPCLKLPYGIKEIPTKVNWEENIPKNSFEWECQMAVSKLFDERPIWPRWSILERLLDDDIPVSYNLLRRLLPRCGYYFSTGPFGQFWIRKGYDPRVDTESRIYQKVEFRLRDLLPNYGGASLSTEYETGDLGMLISDQKYSGADVSHVTKQRWMDICHFQTFPKKGCTLQLFELQDEFIQEKIKDTPWLTMCTHSTGWFSKPTFELLSIRVKIKFLSSFPRKGAQKLLKSLRERFEKMKWLEVLNKEQGQDVIQYGEITKNQPPMDANSEEEVEEAEEAEEVELDEYGSGDGDNGSCSLAASSHIVGENINTSYLQELLCNKIIEGEDYERDEHAHGAMCSDGEYQIYEQDSNDDDDHCLDDGDDDC